MCAQPCLTLGDPMDCGPPDPSSHGIYQATLLEWVAIPFSKGSSRPRDRSGRDLESSIKTQANMKTGESAQVLERPVLTGGDGKLLHAT